MIVNDKVESAGYYFIGHYRQGELKITFSNVGMSIKDSQIKDLNKLFKIFDIDSENGTYLEEIKGRYCRLEFDEERYLVKVGHITEDIWFDVIKKII